MNLNRAPQLKNRVFVFAGRLQRMPRSRAARVLESRGAQVRQTLSSKTDFLVVGRDPGVRAQQATDLGVTILEEAQFIDLLMGRPLGPAPLHAALARLRQWAYDEPSAQTWEQVCGQLDLCGPGELKLALDYLRGLLDRWPSPEGDPSTFGQSLPGGDLRLAPLPWVKALLAGEPTPALQLVRALRYPDQGLSGATAAPLARCQHLSALEELDLQGNPLSAHFLKELANSPHLGKLQRLNLSQVSCGPVALKALLGGSAMARLTHLNLSQAQLGPRGSVSAFQRGGTWPSLRWLSLGGNRLGLEGALALAHLEALQHLQSLDLSRNDLPGGALARLLRQSRPGQLEHLDLRFNKLGREDVQALAAHPWQQPLLTLTLDNNPLRLGGARALASARALHHLERLSLSSAGLEDDGAALLLSIQHLPQLTHLDLGFNQIKDQTAALALERPWSAQLRALRLAGNPLGADFVQALGRATHLRLEALNLRYTAIDPEAATRLLQVPHLRHIPDLRLPLEGYPDPLLRDIAAQADLSQTLRRRARLLLAQPPQEG